MANQKLKTMYDEYKLQLDKNKLSAQNELNKANQKANNYMQNYLKSMGIQDSGMGASAYTNLGSNYASQMAEINQNYSNKLTDFRNTYNQQAKNEAQTLMQGMDNSQLENYANNLTGDSGLDDSTTNYIKNLANLYKAQNDKTAQAKAEQEALNYNNQVLDRADTLMANMTNEQIQEYLKGLGNDTKLNADSMSYINNLANIYQNKNNEKTQTTKEGEQNAYDETAIKRLESYLGGNITKSDQDKYVDKLMSDEKISQSTKDYINEYIDSYGKGWKQDRTNFAENLLSIQGDNAISQSVLDDFYSRIGNAQTEAEYNEAINEFKNISSKMDAFNGIDTTKAPIKASGALEKDFGKFRDTGKNTGNQRVWATNWINKAKNGAVEDGTVVNFNVGAGKPANYVYYDGMWYKTSASADYNSGK